MHIRWLHNDRQVLLIDVSHGEVVSIGAAPLEGKCKALIVRRWRSRVDAQCTKDRDGDEICVGAGAGDDDELVEGGPREDGLGAGKEGELRRDEAQDRAIPAVLGECQ